MNENLKVLEEILEGEEISEFSKNWINKSDTNQDSIKSIYELLKSYGLNNHKIAKNANLLGFNQDTIQRNYDNLTKLGLSKEKIVIEARLLALCLDTIQRNYDNLINIGLSKEEIVSQPILLGLHPNNIKDNYKHLLDMGISKKKIVINARLIGLNPNAIKDNYKHLLDMGISKKKIATNASLIGLNPNAIKDNYKHLLDMGISKKKIATLAHLIAFSQDTIQRNYEYHISLLRHNCKDRSSGKELLLKQPQILEITKKTFEANLQYLNYLDIDYKDNVLLLGTTSQLKRGKLAYLLREVFDYRNVNQSEKKKTIYSLYNFIKNNPSTLVYSIKTLEKEKLKLRKKAMKY